jgi:hypothetical protein
VSSGIRDERAWPRIAVSCPPWLTFLVACGRERRGSENGTSRTGGRTAGHVHRQALAVAVPRLTQRGAHVHAQALANRRHEADTLHPRGRPRTAQALSSEGRTQTARDDTRLIKSISPATSPSDGERLGSTVFRHQPEDSSGAGGPTRAVPRALSLPDPYALPRYDLPCVSGGRRSLGPTSGSWPSGGFRVSRAAASRIPQVRDGARAFRRAASAWCMLSRPRSGSG